MRTLDRAERETRLTLYILQRVRERTKAHPILYDTLATELGIDWRKVAEKVEQLRDSGEWICASQGKPAGCYYAANRLELDEYLQKEHDRVMKQLARHKRQRDFIPPGLTLFDNVSRTEAA